MIYGIGIDTAEVSRIEKSMGREGFREKCFTREELKELGRKKTESAAACFAAKEAFFKALGTGFYPSQLLEVSLLHKENGAPYLALCGGAKTACDENSLRCHVSVTHEAGLATCIVLLEKI